MTYRYPPPPQYQPQYPPHLPVVSPYPVHHQHTDYYTLPSPYPTSPYPVYHTQQAPIPPAGRAVRSQGRPVARKVTVGAESYYTQPPPQYYYQPPPPSPYYSPQPPQPYYAPPPQQPPPSPYYYPPPQQPQQPYYPPGTKVVVYEPMEEVVEDTRPIINEEIIYEQAPPPPEVVTTTTTIQPGNGNGQTIVGTGAPRSGYRRKSPTRGPVSPYAYK